MNANKKEYDIEIILKKLEVDNEYHIRVDTDKNYTFFGDVDGHVKNLKILRNFSNFFKILL